MRPANEVARAIAQFEVKAPARLDERVRADVGRAFEDFAAQPAVGQGLRWRLIAGSRIAQLAAAAVIVMVLWLSLRTWELLGTEAYAVEDTVEALQKVETAHAFCTDWQGRRFEMWIRPDPATGTNDFISVVEPERNSIAVSTPRVSYIYDTRQNSVRFIRGQVITSDLNLASIVESLADATDKKEDSVVTTMRKTTDRYGDVIVLHYSGAVYEGEAWIDPKTRLLLSLTVLRCSNPGEVVKSFDELRYNEPIPEHLLHFRCPDDAEIKPERWGDFDNPKYGLDVEGLSEQQACVKILTELFRAVNAVDLNRLRKLIPVAADWSDPELVAAVQQVAGKSGDDRVSGVADYEIGTPCQDKACPLGVLVPCMVTDHNGGRFAVTFIVRFRPIEGRRSGVVVFTWGPAKSLKDKWTKS